MNQRERGWWQTEPLRIFEIGSAMSDLDSLDPAVEAEKRAAYFPNAEHLHVMAHTRGMDDRGFYFKTEAGSVPNRDYLGEYLPEAHKRGIRVIIYFNVHWYTQEFGQKHPDWLQIREGGEPIDGVYTTGTSFCVNTPYREWCFQVLRDLCAYEIDGVFYDGPIFFASTCYCASCQEKFRALYWKPLPPKSDSDHPDFALLLKFQTQSLVDFLHDSREVINSINPNILFCMNSGGRAANWPTGRMNRELIKEQDLLGTEGGFLYGDLRRTPFWKPGCEAKLIETQSGGKPAVIFNCAGHKSWNFYPLPKAEIRLLYADTIANGANVWFAVFPDDIGQPEIEPIAHMNAFVRDNARYYVGTRSEARVALVWSDVTANFYKASDVSRTDFTHKIKGSDIGNIYAEFAGFYEALLRNHILFDVMDDVSLEGEDLGRYGLIILPNVACMGHQAAQRLGEYVFEGGNILSTFETSLCDEHGRRGDQFRLHRVFGVASKNTILGPREWDYAVSAGEHPITEAITKRWIPSPRYALQVGLADGQALMYLTLGLKGCYDSFPVASPDPFLVVHSWGEGRSVYLPADLGNAVDQFRFPEHLRLVGDSVRWLSRPRLVLNGAPSSLEVVLRSQGRRLLIHLVNFTGEMIRPMESVIPVSNLGISLKDVGEAKSVRALWAEEALEFEVAERTLRFTVPHLSEYELIVVER